MTATRIILDTDTHIRSGGTPFHVAAADQVEIHPPFVAQGYTFLHDPLAAVTVVRSGLVRLESLHVDVEMGGRHTAGATLVRVPTDDAPANVRVGLAVDAGAFEQFLIERLSGENPQPARRAG